MKKLLNKKNFFFVFLFSIHIGNALSANISFFSFSPFLSLQLSTANQSVSALQQSLSQLQRQFEETVETHQKNSMEMELKICHLKVKKKCSIQLVSFPFY